MQKKYGQRNGSIRTVPFSALEEVNLIMSKRRKTKHPKEHNGIAITASLWADSRAYKFFEEGRWKLASFVGETITSFDSESQLEEWWGSIQARKGILSGASLIESLSVPNKVLKNRRATARKSTKATCESMEKLVASDQIQAKQSTAGPRPKSRSQRKPKRVPPAFLKNHEDKLKQQSIDLLTDVFNATFLDFHPDQSVAGITRGDLFRAAENSLGRQLVDHLMVRILQAPPLAEDQDSLVAWFYQTESLKKLNGRSLRESFDALAVAVREIRRMSRSTSGSSFQHRAVGRGKAGGRWGG
jgi:hypothetical protein